MTKRGKEMGEEMTNGEFFAILESSAGDYYKEVIESIVRNKHMNDLSKADIQLIKGMIEFSQKFADAVIVDFINFICASWGGDRGMYTHYLPKEYKKNREREKK
ncbi:hypothetical protein ACFLZC_01260 [Patescibacteria group bacterium]